MRFLVSSLGPVADSDSVSLSAPDALSIAMQRVLDLQSQYSSESTDPMKDRGVIIRHQIKGIVAPWVGHGGWHVRGSDGAGLRSKVPWVRVYNRDRSPSAQSGWYVVYLFAYDGSMVALSLNQGTTTSDGSTFKAKSSEVLQDRVDHARKHLKSHLTHSTRLTDHFNLADPGGLGDGYEAGNVTAITYPTGSIPNDTKLRADLDEMLELLRELDAAPVESSELSPTVLAEPGDATKDLDWLVEQTLWSPGELNEIIETLLTRRPQVVLAGPPGTGKTWTAECLALHLTGGRPGAVHLVQFHPTYAYEDFVEGLRPVAASGSIAFDLVEGVLVKVADRAREVDHPVVLIIDEMNRANLPSVFGELLYLLENRRTTIRLLHRERFSLPDNLYVIGTMNTADRSIRSIDTALRRRFDIFECSPNGAILKAYYEDPSRSNDVAELLEGLELLNSQLAERLDRHHAIGHTFFMQEHFTLNELERTWDRQVKPLIEEYFFDQPDIAKSFSLETLWPGLSED